MCPIPPRSRWRPTVLGVRSPAGWVPALVGLAGIAGAGVPEVGSIRHDKEGYSLFRPVPRAQMRPMELDRPDKTESPYTVDAGHYQLEMDLVNGAWDRESLDTGTRTTTGLAVAPMNWKAGLLNHVDFQCVIQPFNHLRVDDPDAGAPVVRSGFGNIVTRLKVNLWGDDGGATALAVMPYVTWPTAADGLGADHVEGGLIIPFAAELPAGWGLGMMTAADFGSVTQDGVTATVVNTVTLGHDLIGPLAGYIEFFSEVSTSPGDPWIGTLDFGVTWTLSGDWVLDAGINVGVTRSAPDLNPFAGLSHRF